MKAMLILLLVLSACADRGKHYDAMGHADRLDACQRSGGFTVLVGDGRDGCLYAPFPGSVR